MKKFFYHFSRRETNFVKIK